MRCVDIFRHTAAVRSTGAVKAATATCLAALTACTAPPPPAPLPGATSVAGPASAPVPAPEPTPPVAVAAEQRRARNWAEYRQRAAQRLVSQNPKGAHIGPVQQPALAIPVLEIELNGDGSVRKVSVLRQPSQARDTVRLAIDAVHRAAPFGEVSHLPRPWRYTEVFLFDDTRRFKPRTLDE